MTVLSLKVGFSADDGFQDSGSSTATINATTHSVGTGTAASSPDRRNGFRFQSVTIAQAATINTAVVTLCSNGDWTQTDFHWFGENVDNAAVFSTGTNDLSARALTTASLNCSINVSHTAGTFYGFPAGGSHAAIVQEIINRAGWASGNSLALLAVGDGAGNNASSSTRTWDFAGNTSGATLVIDYTAAAPDPSPLLLLPGPTRVRII